MVKITPPLAVLILAWGMVLLFVCSIGSDLFDHAPAEFCDYCAVANHTAKVRILDETENLLVFKSKEPNCYKHYIVIPKEHIKNVHAENATCEIIREMTDFCDRIMDDEGIRQGRKMIVGNPPFNRVNHLYLDCMACNAADESWDNLQMYANEFMELAVPKRFKECVEKVGRKEVKRIVEEEL
jgi:diadenosine tetraphosphate (Ap4A) HIT family hydrolase